MRRLLAFDLGASSGRAILGEYDGERLTLQEIHRFLNEPERLNGGYYWDFLRLWREIKLGLHKAAEAGGFDRIGIDTWGVDYGYLDKEGRLMGLPRHYRDDRNERMANKLSAQLPQETLYRGSGIQHLSFNTIYQLCADLEEQPWLPEHADRILFLPDLLAYLLTGEQYAEVSIASTSALLAASTQDWNYPLLEQLGIPTRLLPPVCPAGGRIAPLTDAIREELKLPPAEVVAVAGHDTASAVLSVPSEEEDVVYISCGTWSLFGTELDQPNTSSAACAANFTNEIGYGGKIRFLKNIMGLWPIQQSKQTWAKQGQNLGYGELEKLASECAPYTRLVDVDDGRFFPPGDIPARVAAFCQETGQTPPDSIGATMRCLYDSLAFKYRFTLETLQNLTGKKYTCLHMVGGGIQGRLLSQLTADICGIPVVTGPVEATAIGNIAAQLLAGGELADVKEARALIRRSFPLETFLPKEDRTAEEEAWQRYQALLPQKG